MNRVEPKVYLIGETTIHSDVMYEYLRDVGAKEYRLPQGVTSCEVLVEFMGRLCYRSWEPGLNANVTKVRSETKDYIGNILKSKHGSVLEHPVTHWVFSNVSRVFTHELVRHRAGMAFSQESLRFVRLEDLGLWLPPEIEAEPDVVKLFEETFTSLGDLQKKLAVALKLDGKPFSEKKKLTSAMRRVAPIGLATTIGVTANFRALRHILEMRTAGGAEAEIKFVIDRLATLATERWPHIFQDFERKDEGEWMPKHSKV